MKNKFISLILAFSMFSCLNIAYAADDGQIIGLEFAQDGAVTDSFGTELTVHGTTSARVISSMAGETVVLDSTGSIELNADSLINKDEATFEVWVNINSDEKSGDRKVIALKDPDVSVAMAEVSYSYLSEQAVLKNRLATKTAENPDTQRWIETSTEDISGYSQTWRHYAFTRKWDETQQKWTTNTYINGVLSNSANESGVRLDETGCKLFLGSNTKNVTGWTKGLMCSYGAFNVYTKALDAAKIKELYENSQNSYKELANDLTALSTTPAEGRISNKTGLITVKFSNYIDTATADGNILFCYANGKEVAGYDVEIREGIFADITIPMLQSGEGYKVIIKEGLKSVNEISAEAKEYNFSGYAENAIIDIDFTGDEFVVGQQVPWIEGLAFRSGHEQGKSTYIKVGETEKGTRYIRFSPIGINLNEWLVVPLGGLTEGCPVIEYKLRRGGDATGAETGQLNYTNGTSVTPLDVPIKIDGNVVDTDEEGFVKIKAVLQKGANGYYDTIVTYKSGGKEKEYVINQQDTDKFASLTAYVVVQFYQSSGEISPQNYVDLSYLCYYILNEPKVADSNITAFDVAKDEEITVTFNEKIQQDTISAETVKLINKESGETIPWTYQSYKDSTKTASFKVDKTYLDYNTEYDIDCYGVVTNEGISNASSMLTSFTTPSQSTTLSNTVFEKTDAGVSFSTTVSAASGDATQFIAVLYDANGRVTQVKQEGITGNGSVNVLLDNADITSGYYVKVIAADNSGVLSPIVKATLDYIVE